MPLIKFINELLKKETKVGSIVPSGFFLIHKMLQPIPKNKAVKVLELGAGTGVVTKHLVKNLHKDSEIHVIELNKTFITKLEHRFQDKPNVHIHQHSAMELDQLFNPKEFDFIVSSLPVSLFKQRDRYRLIGHISNFLKEDAYYIQFHYASKIKGLYQFFFDEVKTNYAFLNIPPAFIFICRNFAK